ncbi:hypothetical protein [Planomicrobium okeanokoites]|uniref:hypothetical protein n=1 Tax=Planomicrobium okeanokoites TaxID=244 RepID=UPI002492A65B|nr:hypothetical protein [Planomicrobium okeanokoites]
MPESDTESLHAAHPGSEVLIIDCKNYVLKAVTDEGKNGTVYSDSDLPLADGLLEGDCSIHNIK